MRGCDQRAHVRLAFDVRGADFHRLDQIGDDVMKEGFLLPQLVTVANRTADDAPEHITAAFVAGNHTIDNHERRGADVIGDHFQRVVG